MSFPNEKNQDSQGSMNFGHFGHKNEYQSKHQSRSLLILRYELTCDEIELSLPKIMPFRNIHTQSSHNSYLPLFFSKARKEQAIYSWLQSENLGHHKVTPRCWHSSPPISHGHLITFRSPTDSTVPSWQLCLRLSPATGCLKSYFPITYSVHMIFWENILQEKLVVVKAEMSGEGVTIWSQGWSTIVLVHRS